MQIVAALNTHLFIPWLSLFTTISFAIMNYVSSMLMALLLTYSNSWDPEQNYLDIFSWLCDLHHYAIKRADQCLNQRQRLGENHMSRRSQYIFIAHYIKWLSVFSFPEMSHLPTLSLTHINSLSVVHAYITDLRR